MAPVSSLLIKLICHFLGVWQRSASQRQPVKRFLKHLREHTHANWADNARAVSVRSVDKDMEAPFE
jgi:hypothetical protein